jgi:hypothetical protein
VRALLSLHPRDEIAAAFRANPAGDDLPASYNIAPSLPIFAIRF